MILEDVLPVKNQTPDRDVIFYHLVYISSRVKPGRSGSGVLSVIAHDMAV